MDSIAWSKQAGQLARSTNKAVMALGASKRVGVSKRVQELRGLTSRRSDDNRVKKNVRSRRSPLSFRLEDLDLHYDPDNLDSLLARPKPVPNHKRSRLLEPESFYEDLNIYEDPKGRIIPEKPASDPDTRILQSLTPDELLDRFTDFDLWYERYGRINLDNVRDAKLPTGDDLNDAFDIGVRALSHPFRERDWDVLNFLMRLVECRIHRLEARRAGWTLSQPFEFELEDKYQVENMMREARWSHDTVFLNSVCDSIYFRMSERWGFSAEEEENMGPNFSESYFREY